ncbi:hypothetical protein [Pseudonocardia sp. WMMC193]|uniref:hypothetical protein n=1 Tax=Pseudonocardia sp. WMMC193 TaxID=2911965 RepID=UPI001F3529A2|nr:hypothetical protein [Pseudonocardia sp. WMMC193]MCF7550660.1 hypothetical protein [Pseudonocardia sp. WMMC193]
MTDATDHSSARPDLIGRDEIATDPATDLQDLEERDTELADEEFDPTIEADPADVLEQRRIAPEEEDGPI